MTGSDLERVRPPVDSWIDVMGPVGKLSGIIAKTEFVPTGLRNKPDAVAAAILTGRELGLSPLTALRGINVIEGRPSLTGELLGARILAAGHRLEWIESTDTKATVRIERGDGLSEATASWSMRDAERAGLAKKSNWQKYPRDMLAVRALTEAARRACPDVALGLDTAAAPDARETPPRAEGTVTVQVAPRTRQEAPVEPSTPAPEPADIVDAEIVQETLPEPADDAETQPDGPITSKQLRHAHALVSEIARLGGYRLDPDQKRAFIVRHAGLDPETVDSLNQLSEIQAGWAIASMTATRDEYGAENAAQ